MRSNPNPSGYLESLIGRITAHVEYAGHIGLWKVMQGGCEVRAFRTRQAAQRLANRLNGEITR